MESTGNDVSIPMYIIKLKPVDLFQNATCHATNRTPSSGSLSETVNRSGIADLLEHQEDRVQNTSKTLTATGVEEFPQNRYFLISTNGIPTVSETREILHDRSITSTPFSSSDMKIDIDEPTFKRELEEIEQIGDDVEDIRTQVSESKFDVNLQSSSCHSTTTIPSVALSETGNISVRAEFHETQGVGVKREIEEIEHTSNDVDNKPTQVSRSKFGVNLQSSSSHSTTAIPSVSLSETVKISGTAEISEHQGDGVNNRGRALMTTEKEEFSEMASPSDTSSASETEEILNDPCLALCNYDYKAGKRGRRRAYFGDCSFEDTPNSEQAQRNWEIAKKTVEAQRKKIKNLHTTIRRLKAKVSSLTSLVDILKKKNSGTDNT